MYDPINGETPLASLPKYGGAGGSQQAMEYYAAQDFVKQFGRNPTQSELTMIAPAYAGDPNLTNSATGRAAISQYFQSLSNTPDQIAKSNQEKYLKEAPKHFDSVNSLFQSQLGRAATQDELNHFGSVLASGSTDQYQLQQFLQQQPEYTSRQDEQFRNKLSGQLQTSDKEYFGSHILPSIQETYAKQGRSFDSSAFQNAATQSAQAQNTQRDQYLAQLSASQYGGRQEQAYQDYANMVQNQQGLTNAGINARYQGVQNTQNRINDLSDYNMQAQAYNQYLAKYGKRNNGLGGALGMAVGGGLGALLAGPGGGPMGAMVGSQIGGAFGQAGQNAYGGSY